MVAYFANYSVDYFATRRVSGFINTFNMSTNSSVCDGNIVTVIHCLYHAATYMFTEAAGIYAMQFYVVLINASRRLWTRCGKDRVVSPLLSFQ